MNMHRKSFAAALAIAGGITMTAIGAGTALASSHREAPLIAEDPCADNTDLYTFISPNNPDSLVVIANYIPLLIPASGPNFYKPCDSVAYDINFDNDGDAKTDLTYRFLFKTTTANGDTFLYNTGPVDSLISRALNVKQTYNVSRIDQKARTETVVARNVPVAPWYVGDRSFPSNTYNGIRQSAATTVKGRQFFVGPSDEAFFVDLRAFDLLGVGGQPSTDGLNVMTIAMEVPIADVAFGGMRPTASTPGPKKVVGVYASAARQRIRVLRRDADADVRGAWIQVSRLAVPLVNEVINPRKDKDKFNKSFPQFDVANFGANILYPELNGLLRSVLNVPCQPIPTGGRTDIVAILSPQGTKAADLQRIDVSSGQTFAQSSFPNGRTLENDVFDIEATLLCSSDFSVPISDGVNANDKPSSPMFPYIPPPASGGPLNGM